MHRLYVQECRDKSIPENDIGKSWLYRDIFNTEFNLAFHQPDVDACNDCDRYHLLIKEATSEEDIAKVKERQKCNLIEVSLRSGCGSTEMSCYTTSNKWKLILTMITLDSELLCKGSCVMWDETKGGRGGNEMASGVLNWEMQELPNSDVEEITVCSDSCAGRNSNFMLIACYLWLLHTFMSLKVINHKYLLKCLGHVEVDTIHAIIERAKKELT
ncbi:hypothetical protein PR048_028756 [Dryococelus australis]|uniref:Uncharacterized protein n=1 Tax=Dryococelus australis TaxID=614101 RepID=A0ABQ9GBW2_9NEOP|nr:hypothetical protein PR048_028756 [Dryococelus australis]